MSPSSVRSFSSVSIICCRSCCLLSLASSLRISRSGSATDFLKKKNKALSSLEKIKREKEDLSYKIDVLKNNIGNLHNAML